MDNELLQEIYQNAMLYLPKLPAAIVVVGVGSMLIRFLKKIAGKLMQRFKLEAALLALCKPLLPLPAGCS